jgi:hypothetical protein
MSDPTSTQTYFLVGLVALVLVPVLALAASPE